MRLLCLDTATETARVGVVEGGSAGPAVVVAVSIASR